MRLQPPGDGAGLAIEVQQEGAVGVTLAQREIIHTEDLRDADRRTGRTTDHPQQGVPTDSEAERLAQPRSRCPPEREPQGEETCRQSQRPPRPGRCNAG
jgi:hypothetical protein